MNESEWPGSSNWNENYSEFLRRAKQGQERATEAAAGGISFDSLRETMEGLGGNAVDRTRMEVCRAGNLCRQARDEGWTARFVSGEFGYQAEFRDRKGLVISGLLRGDKRKALSEACDLLEAEMGREGV